MKEILNDLFDYPDLKIYQYVEGFKFSLDSILLAEYVKITSKTKHILDLCSGNASVPLILSTKTKASIDAFELQEEISILAKKSVSYNNLESQIQIYNADINNIDLYKKNKKYDIITCNPPYFKTDDKNHINETEVLAIARHEIKINLEDIFKIAASHLDDKGEFYMVHRVTRLDEIIILGNKYNLNVKNIQLIKTKEDGKPYIVLIRCIKNSKLGVKINREINIGNLESYQYIFKEEL